jgi:hypothetical protein
MNANDLDLEPRTNFLSANWREIVFTVLAIVAFFFARLGVQKIDGTAGVTDFGALDIVLFALTASLAAHLAVWVVLRIALKTFSHYLDDKVFRADFIALAGPRRLAAALGVIGFELWLILRFAAIVAGAK